MAKRTRWSWVGLGGTAALVVGSSLVPVQAAPPSIGQILAFTPRQTGVDCAYPSEEQQKSCKISVVKGRKGSGWLLADAAGAPLRRFYDSNDDNHVDVWSYYKDGAEVYRETDSNFNRKPDQFRWLHAGGTKWGVDVNEDGRIDSWKVISPEEISQEILMAVAANDYGRLQALLMTEAEIKALEMAPAEAQRIRENLKQCQTKFDELCAKVKGLTKPTWLHLETSAPQCRPADEAGSRYDLVKHPRGTVLFEAAGKSDWLQTGEMVKIGDAWRLVEGPMHGAAGEQPMPAPAAATSPKIQKLLEELAEIDKTPPMTGMPGANNEVVKYNLRRADVLEKIIAEVPAKDRDTWIRQLADSLNTAMQNSSADDKVSSTRMAKLEKQMIEQAAGTNLTAYVVFKRMQAEHNVLLLSDAAFAKVQAEWVEQLTKFVAAYPKADDTAEALLEAGVTCEFLTKDTDAKKWYGQLVAEFGDRQQAVKARGAIKRLDSEGKEMTLSGPKLDGSNFDLSTCKGQVVAVYYWASWNQQPASDFEKLKKLVETHGEKGFSVVCINLDTTAKEAAAAVQKLAVPGIHLHQEGGLDSALATEYGVMVLPQMFLVGKDGKVVSRSVQASTLEEEVKKLMK